MHDILISFFSHTNIEIDPHESESLSELFDADTLPSVTLRHSAPYNTRSRTVNVDGSSPDTPSISLLDENKSLELLERNICKKHIESRYVIN